MDTELRPGSEPVDGYTLVDRLGRGGFGEVWKATGPGGFQVALKFVSLEGHVGPVELRALEVIKHIRHPHLLSTFGSWESAGHLIIAMELAERTLLDRFREAAGQGFPGIPAPEVFEHFLDASKALDFLNEPRHPAGGSGPQGIQHRDVKPQNLLLVGGSVKVADFGLARVLENSQTGHTGSMTLSYAAPEFFDHKTSSQSDQYSLAVTYCHLRGGRLPFEGNPAAVMAGHVMRPPDLSMIPQAEREAVGRALSKSPRDRWPSCRSFVQAVMDAGTVGAHAPPTVRPSAAAAEDDHPDQWATTTPEPEPEPTPEIPAASAAGPSRRRPAPRLVATGLVVVGVAIAAAAVLSRPGRPSGPPSDGPVDRPPAVEVAVKPPGQPPPPVPPSSASTPAPGSGPATSTAKQDARAQIDRGLGLLAADSHEPAIAAFSEAIRIDPASALALAGRSLAEGLSAPFGGHAPSKKGRMALADAEEAVRIDPSLGLAHAARGVALTIGRSPDFARALAECDEAIRLFRGLALIRVARAQVYLDRGSREDKADDFKSAERDATVAIGADSRSATAYLLRGNARRLMEDYDGALEDFDAALLIAPESPMNYLSRGMLWRARGGTDRAIGNFSKAIRIDPKFLPAYRQRAEAFQSKGETDKAAADRQEAGRIRAGLE